MKIKCIVAMSITSAFEVEVLDTDEGMKMVTRPIAKIDVSPQMMVSGEGLVEPMKTKLTDLVLFETCDAVANKFRTKVDEQLMMPVPGLATA